MAMKFNEQFPDQKMQYPGDVGGEHEIQFFVESQILRANRAQDTKSNPGKTETKTSYDPVIMFIDIPLEDVRNTQKGRDHPNQRHEYKTDTGDGPTLCKKGEIESGWSSKKENRKNVDSPHPPMEGRLKRNQFGKEERKTTNNGQSSKE